MAEKNLKVPNLRFKEFGGGWMSKKLGEVAEKINSGKTPLGGEAIYTSEGVIFIRSQNVNNDSLELGNTVFISEETNEKMQNSVVYPNDILLNITGASLGRSCVVPDDFSTGNVNQHVCIIRLNEKCNPRFVQPILSSGKGQNVFQSLQTGSGREGLNFENIKGIQLYFPSLNEQNRIADLFSMINIRIQTQNKIIEDLRLLKQTLVKKLFSQQLKFKDKNGSNYPDWQFKKLGDVTRIINKRNKNNEKLPVYSINNRLGFVPQNEQFEGIDSGDRGYDIKLYKIINKNTFAYNPARINVGSIGYSGDLENIIISSLYVCFITKDSVNDEFLFQYLRTDLFNTQVLKNVEGGVRQYLFYENFARIKFKLPCLEEQMKIADFLSAIDNKFAIEISVLHHLENQKKYLLQNLFI